MKSSLILTFLSACLFSLMAQPAIEFILLDGIRLSKPVDIANDGIHDNWLYVVDHEGTIQLIKEENGVWTANETPFLDILAVNPDFHQEASQGLIALSFHPDYENNGYFFINYNFQDEDGAVYNRLSRLSISEDPAIANTEETEILTVFEPYHNHNMNDLQFGLDGYLYISLGDGGMANDPHQHGQDLSVLYGKMLRIDVNGALPYEIPADNPFVGHETAREEIWAYGLRNPWKFSFDKLTGDLWIADVGQKLYEEINFQAASSTGGENYGWDCKEAIADGKTGGATQVAVNCDDPEFINAHVEPVIYYEQQIEDGASVTGGYVYRGTDYPLLEGYYIFVDYRTGDFYTSTFDETEGWVTNLQNINKGSIATFGESVDGEIYAASIRDRAIYKISATTSLAVQLLDFKAFRQDGKVHLNWITSSETNLDSYIVERAKDEKSFEFLKKIPANNSASRYEITDDAYLSGTHFYRLYSIDKSGKKEALATRIIHLKEPVSLEIFPNPLAQNELLKLSISGAANNSIPATVEITDEIGRVVFTKQWYEIDLPFQYQLDMNQLPAGIYALHLKAGNEVIIQSIVKQ